MISGTKLFQTGKLLFTRSVNEAVATDSKVAAYVFDSLRRYCKGDWGVLGAEDKASNDAAVKLGNRILAKYKVPVLGDIYIITEWDRSVTTVLRTDEY